MRRALCICEPHIALAGDTNTWKFVYTPSITLPKGARVKFDLQSRGRNIDWQIPSADLKKNSNVIYALTEDGRVLSAKEIETPDGIVPQFEFVLPSELKAGKPLTICMGAPPKSTGDALRKQGNMAQTYVQRRKPFNLYVDPKGYGRYDDSEPFSLDIRGNKLHHIHIITPSFVARNKRFDIIVRFEDLYGNLTSNAPEGTLIDLSYEHLRENLNWKLFVPETGFVTLPNLYFNETGVYRIQLRNLTTKETFISAPMKCFSDCTHYLYWGLLHGESDRVDSTESIESCLRHFRDERAFNFIATSPFDTVEETSNDLWRLISQCVSEFNEDDRFSTFLGFQWQGESPEEGMRQIIYAKEQKPILRQKDPKSSSLKKIYKTFSPKELISIPTFTMGEGVGFDFQEHNPDFERVVEIYNAWGSSESTKSAGNPRPINRNGKVGIAANAEGAIQAALQQNCRFGFVAGGLDDRGPYGECYEGDQEQYSPGLTGIIAKQHSRESLFEALYNRSCYATTGKEIIVGLSITGQGMGGELSTQSKPGLVLNRHIAGYIAGTDRLKSVEIIRNGEVIKTFSSPHNHLDFTYDDLEDLKTVVLDGGEDKPPFVYYYLRVIQEDNHMAWSSPIWIDYHGALASTKKPKKITKK